MSLLADIEAESRGSGPRCSIAKLLAEMDEGTAAELRSVVDDPAERFTGTAIARGLRKHGYTTSGDSILRHRRRDCKCPS